MTMDLHLRCGCRVAFEYVGEPFFTVDCPDHGPQKIVRAFG